MNNKSDFTREDVSLKKTKALSVISMVLLILAIIFCLSIILQVTIQGYVGILGYSVFRISSPSMEPTLPVDTFIISQKVDISEIGEEDIICFVSKESYLKGKVVTHRVVESKEIDSKICLITKGDNNNSVDAAYVTRDNLVGKMVFKTEPDGFISTAYKFVTQKQAFFLIIILPMLIIAGFLFKNGIKKIREQINDIKREIENGSISAEEQSETDSDRSNSDQE